MNINWKLRFQNKATLTAFVLQLITIAYNIAGLFGLTLPFDQSTVTKFAETVIGLLVMVGVVVDPTTNNGVLGVSDSAQALSYEEPKQD